MINIGVKKNSLGLTVGFKCRGLSCVLGFKNEMKREILKTSVKPTLKRDDKKEITPAAQGKLKRKLTVFEGDTQWFS